MKSGGENAKVCIVWRSDNVQLSGFLSQRERTDVRADNTGTAHCALLSLLVVVNEPDIKHSQLTSYTTTLNNHHNTQGCLLLL